MSVIASLWISPVPFSPTQLHSPCPALLLPLLYTVFHPRYCSLLSSRESSIRAVSHSSVLHSSNVTHQMSESPQPFNHYIAPSPIQPLHRSLSSQIIAAMLSMDMINPQEASVLLEMARSGNEYVTAAFELYQAGTHTLHISARTRAQPLQISVYT